MNRSSPVSYLKLSCFTFPKPNTLQGNLGRNSVTGPGLMKLDVSIFKDNFIKRISEAANAQLRVEVFNVLNHVNFAAPLDHRTIFDQNGRTVPGAGLIDSTSTPSRQIGDAVHLVSLTPDRNPLNQTQPRYPWSIEIWFFRESSGCKPMLIFWQSLEEAPSPS